MARFVLFSMLALLPGAVFAEPLNNFSPQQVANRRCQAGIGINNLYNPIPEGGECLRTTEGCEGVENGVAISYCQKGICVAKTGCDGKSLEGLPDQPTQSGVSAIPNVGTSVDATSGTGSSASGGEGTSGPLPSGGNPLISPSVPVSTPAASSGGATDPAAPSMLPPVVVEQNQTITPVPHAIPGAGGGTTFTPTSVGSVSPGTGSTPGAPTNSTVGHGLWAYPGSTFQSPLTNRGSTPGSFSQNLFTSLLSNMLSGLVGNLLVGSNDGAASSVGNPTPTAVSASLQPGERRVREAPRLSAPRTALIDGKPIVVRNENGEWRFYVQQPDGSLEPADPEKIREVYSSIQREPIQGELDELSQLYRGEIGNGGIPSFTLQDNTNRSSTNVEDRRGEPVGSEGGILDQLDPYWRLPAEPLSDVYRFSSALNAGNAVPLHIPDSWSPGIVSTYNDSLQAGYTPLNAYARARTLAIEAAFAGLEGGRLAPGSEEVQVVRVLLQEDLAIARQERERAYLTSSLGLMEMVDRLISFSPEQRAVDVAEARLAALGELEARARIGMFAGTMVPPDISSQNQPLVRVVDTPFTFGPGHIIDVLAPSTWIHGGATIRQPLPSSNLLSGLSSVASSVVERVREVANRLGDNVLKRNGSDTVFETSPNPPAVISPSGVTVTSSTPGVFAEAVEVVRSVLWYTFGSGVPPETQIPTVQTELTLERPRAPMSPEITTPPVSPTPPPQTTSMVPASGNGSPLPSRSSDGSPGTILSSGNQGFAQMGIGFIRTLIQSLSTLFMSENSNNPASSALQSSGAVVATATVTANPSLLSSGGVTKIAWSSIGAESCAIVDSTLNVISRGVSGEITSAALFETTRFGVICNIQGGADKFLNEAEVLVEGSASTTPPLFSNSGRASTAMRATGNEVANGGDSGIKPVDIRTCDPHQSMNSFIQCLCEAEPNPAGCTTPPGGL